MLYISKHEYVFSFNLTFKFDDYSVLVFQNNMHTNRSVQDRASADRRSHLASIVRNSDIS